VLLLLLLLLLLVLLMCKRVCRIRGALLLLLLVVLTPRVHGIRIFHLVFFVLEQRLEFSKKSPTLLLLMSPRRVLYTSHWPPAKVIHSSHITKVGRRYAGRRSHLTLLRRKGTRGKAQSLLSSHTGRTEVLRFIVPRERTCNPFELSKQSPTLLLILRLLLLRRRGKGLGKLTRRAGRHNWSRLRAHRCAGKRGLLLRRVPIRGRRWVLARGCARVGANQTHQRYYKEPQQRAFA